MNTLVYLVRKIGASCFFLGYFPWASGTLASAVTVVALYFGQEHLAFILGAKNFAAYWWVIVTLTAISFFLTDRGQEVFGDNDSRKAVFDEVVGQFITFFMVPISLRTLILGFVLFRFFDIVKPFPVYKLEEIEGGVGVTMDDVGAGVLANITLMFTLWLYHWVMGYF